MKMLFLFLGIFAQLLIISTSSIPSEDDNERGLKRAYHRYIVDPNPETYYHFRRLVISYYNNYPVDCLKWAEQFRSNWIFKALYWNALSGVGFIIPSVIVPSFYSKILKWISSEIRRTLIHCGWLTEKDLRDEGLETTLALVKAVERSLYELKSLGITDEITNATGDLIPIWKFLIFSFSFDFSSKANGYHSLIRTLQEIIFITSTGPSSVYSPLRLSRLYALLWVYLCHIYHYGREIILDLDHLGHKALIIYLIMKFESDIRFYCCLGEFYPKDLKTHFEELYGTGKPQLDPIVGLLKQYNPYNYSNWLNKQMKFQTFRGLSHHIDDRTKQTFSELSWEVSALAQLELFLFRNGQKVVYSFI